MQYALHNACKHVHVIIQTTEPPSQQIEEDMDCDSSEPSSSSGPSLPSSSEGLLDGPSSKFPKLNNRRKNCVNGFFPKKPSRTKKAKSPTDYMGNMIKELLQRGLELDHFDHTWATIITYNDDSVIKSITGFNEENKTNLVKKFLRARNLYKCYHCLLFSKDLLDSGLQLCSQCELQCHNSCSNNCIKN